MSSIMDIDDVLPDGNADDSMKTALQQYLMLIKLIVPAELQLLISNQPARILAVFGSDHRMRRLDMESAQECAMSAVDLFHKSL